MTSSPVAGLPADPGRHPAVDVVAADHDVRVLGLAGHRDVGDDPAALVQPLRVDDPADRGVDVVRADPVEHGHRVRSLYDVVRHQRHVEDREVLARVEVLLAGALERLTAFEAPLDRRGDARAGEVVGVLPAAGRDEVGAVGDVLGVVRRPAHVASEPGLGVRPGQVVEQEAQPLDGALLAEQAGGLELVRPVHADAGDVERRVLLDQPLRHHVAEPAAGQDADGVEAAGEVQAVDLGRLPEHRREVVGEALRPAEEGADPGVLESGEAPHRDLEERRQPVPVGREHGERAVARRAVQGPGLPDRLEHADQQAAALLAVVAVGLAVLDHRHRLRRDACDRLGQQVVVLGSLERHGDTGLGRDLAAPQTRGDHDLLALDVAAFCADGDHPAAGEDEVGDLGVLEDPGAALLGALGQRHRHVHRVGPALVGGPEAVDDVVGPHQRHQVGHLALRQDLLGHPDRAHVRRLAAEPLVGAWRGRELEVAALAEAGREPGLLLEPGVQLGGVARHPERVLRRASGDHLAGGVPRGPGRQLLALQEHHVGRTQQGEVVGDRRTDHAAADHDVLSPGRQVTGRRRCALGSGGSGVDGSEVERHDRMLPLIE